MTAVMKDTRTDLGAKSDVYLLQQLRSIKRINGPDAASIDCSQVTVNEICIYADVKIERASACGQIILCWIHSQTGVLPGLPVAIIQSLPNKLQ